MWKSCLAMHLGFGFGVKLLCRIVSSCAGDQDIQGHGHWAWVLCSQSYFFKTKIGERLTWAIVYCMILHVIVHGCPTTRKIGTRMQLITNADNTWRAGYWQPLRIRTATNACLTQSSSGGSSMEAQRPDWRREHLHNTQQYLINWSSLIINTRRANVMLRPNFWALSLNGHFTRFYTLLKDIDTKMNR